MKKRLLKISAPMLACIVVMAMCHVASAYPGYTAGCTGCHQSAGDGGPAITPDPIDIAVDDSGSITFDNVPILVSMAQLVLEGLGDPNLAASVGAGWTFDAGNSTYVSSVINSGDPTYTLDLGIGASAVQGGPYTVNVWTLGKSSGAKYLATAFDVNVVPEPTTLALLGMAGLGLCILRRRR
jgi:PEP-CTERM motif-containing protein